jgi:hypothetical protein
MFHEYFQEEDGTSLIVGDNGNNGEQVIICEERADSGELSTSEDVNVPAQLPSDEIKELVRKFCDGKDCHLRTKSEFISFLILSSGEALEIINSDYKVEEVPLRKKSEDGNFSCVVCPILSNHGSGFKRRYNLQQHYQMHFKVRARFSWILVTTEKYLVQSLPMPLLQLQHLPPRLHEEAHAIFPLGTRRG